MGEDWREFRAHLVAREHADEEMATSSPKDNSKRSSSLKEEGGIFGAISSIFSKGDSSKKEETSETNTAATATDQAKKTVKENVNIFDGDAIGGATKFSKIEVAVSPCDDPFMDQEECHLVYDDSDVKLDRHRWAHPLFHVEPGCILVANEKLGGVFHQTVVLIIDHNEQTGSTGMVINR